MVYIGFTGTRTGMTEAQHVMVAHLLSEKAIQHQALIRFHHGDCIGSDAQAHAIARGLNAKIVIHPPAEQDFRANCQGDEMKPPLAYLERNKKIVDSSRTLIATPGTMVAKARSGTWSTIRYAQKEGRDVVVVLPDGSLM